MFHVRADRQPPRRRLSVAALVTAALLPVGARADVEWHPDLETAHAAARISRRPVLAVFVASWGEGAARLEETCLQSPEAEAVLAACFEPVRIDIDEHADLTRAANVTHVPTACVLGADDATLARFEMPATPPAFVTAAILAARQAAESEHGGGSGRIAGLEPSGAGTADAATSTTRPPRGSVARVTAKVRDLSAFAAADTRPAADTTPVAIERSAQPAGPQASNYALMSWPAETVAAAPAATASAPAIEPAATQPASTTAAPWLDGAAAATRPLPPPAPPAPQPAPSQSGLIATLQKPFAAFGTPAVDPPTVPPALPRGPLAGLAPQPTPAPPAVPEPGVPMPLGLEGYCPVTLVDRGSWIEGRAQWGARHRGRTYLFAGADEQRTFLADPDRYAPALSGDDPVLALDRGASTPGQRRYGVTYQARMYLFATPETRSAFAADPARYATRIALAERTPPTGAVTRTY